MTTQPRQKQNMWIFRETFLAKEWNSFPSLWEETRLRLPQGFYLNMNVKCTWSNHSLPCNAISLLPTTPSNHGWFAIETIQWTNIPTSRDTTRIQHFCSYDAAGNEAHMVVEWPLYNPIKDKVSITIWERSTWEPQVFLSIRPTS